MPTSITIASGKCKAFRNDLSDGGSPFSEILAETDGAICGIQDLTGKVWIFRIYNAKVQYKLSTDTIGSAYGAWTDVVASLVSDGVPTAEQLATGRIEVCYWKTDDKWYRSFSDNSGTSWTEEEITTA